MKKILLLLFLVLVFSGIQAQYCTNAAGSNAYADIGNVTIANLNNSSACNSLVGSQGLATGTANLYSDFTNSTVPIPKLLLGNKYTLSVTILNCSGGDWSNTTRAFIDWNNDGDFNDFSEFAYILLNQTGYPGGTVSIDITVPNNIPKGFKRMRIVTRETTDSLSTQGFRNGINYGCGVGNWGETEDYIIEAIRYDTTVRLESIENIPLNLCETTSLPVTFKVKNDGDSTQNAIPMTYNLNNAVLVNETFSVPNFKADHIATLTFTSPITSGLKFGQNTLTVYSRLPRDKDLNGDTLVYTFNYFPNPPTPKTITDTVCIGNPTYTVSVEKKDASTKWFNAANVFLGSGSSYTAASPLNDITLFAQHATINTINIGPFSNSGASTTSATNLGLRFNILKPNTTIKKVDFYSNFNGVINVRVRNAANAVIFQKEFAIYNFGVNKLDLNLVLPQGNNYTIDLVNASDVSTFQTNFNQYPIVYPDVISINNALIGTTASTTIYPYFYNWEIEYDQCVSSLVPVTVKKLNQPIPPLNLPPFLLGCTFPVVELDAQNPGATYLWNTGATTQKIKVTGSQSYSVAVRDAIGCKNRDTTVSFLNPSPIFSLGKDTTVCASANFVLKSGYNNAGFDHYWSNNSRDTKIIPNKSGEYILTVLNTQNSCTFSDTINVSLMSSPKFSLGLDSTLCAWDSISIGAPSSTGLSYLWSDGSTINSKTIKASGTYQLTVTDNITKCVSIDSVKLNFVNVSVPNLSNDTSVCSDKLEVHLPNLPNHLYSWSDGSRLLYRTFTRSSNLVLFVSYDGTFCTRADSFKVNILGNDADLNLGNDITVCESSYLIRAPRGFSRYLWQDNSALDTFRARTSGTYWVEANTPCGIKRDSLNIEFLTSSSIKLQNDTTVCDPLNLKINSQPVNSQILWSTGETTDNITVNTTGNYWVSVSNACGTYSDAVQVNFGDALPIMNFTHQISQSAISINDNSTGVYSYFWDFGDGTNSREQSPIHKYDVDDIYTIDVKLTNFCGQSVDTSFDIDVRASSSIATTNESEILVYPTQFVADVTIKSMDNKAWSLATLNSIEGKLIAQYKFQSPLQIISLKNLAQGSYILNLYQDEYKIKSFRLFKSK
ncbi:MAG: PKD domain-containing protein [Chitinophagales bacterium]|nr:PKD domain-containing protein [Chitinophagales bacterium]